jgi:hypothetical protein
MTTVSSIERLRNEKEGNAFQAIKHICPLECTDAVWFTQRLLTALLSRIKTPGLSYSQGFFLRPTTLQKHVDLINLHKMSEQQGQKRHLHHF